MGSVPATHAAGATVQAHGHLQGEGPCPGLWLSAAPNPVQSNELLVFLEEKHGQFPVSLFQQPAHVWGASGRPRGRWCSRHPRDCILGCLPVGRTHKTLPALAHRDFTRSHQAPSSEGRAGVCVFDVHIQRHQTAKLNCRQKPHLDLGPELPLGPPARAVGGCLLCLRWGAARQNLLCFLERRPGWAAWCEFGCRSIEGQLKIRQSELQ